MGGLTQSASLDQINLAEVLEDGMKIYVPNIEEKVEQDHIGKLQQSQKINKVLNLNTATLYELDTLPGIGESTAQKIIEYRQQNGDFKTTEEIMDVSGIGEAKFSSIKKLITVK